MAEYSLAMAPINSSPVWMPRQCGLRYLNPGLASFQLHYKQIVKIAENGQSVIGFHDLRQHASTTNAGLRRKRRACDHQRYWFCLLLVQHTSTSIGDTVRQALLSVVLFLSPSAWCMFLETLCVSCDPLVVSVVSNFSGDRYRMIDHDRISLHCLIAFRRFHPFVAHPVLSVAIDPTWESGGGRKIDESQIAIAYWSV